ncbi:uncharacterized protein [Palaemon carinicauda]|uniref:uncharacterized protein isoform X2 n=1 Tax=Palaemon carinicauda TaxID=392227 RepID=UPI0035B64964
MDLPVLSDFSCSESDLEDNNTVALKSINSVLKQAEEAHERCLSKRSEWGANLTRAESIARQEIREEFRKALSYLEIWEDQFQKELCEAFNKRRVLLERKLNDIHSHQNNLSKAMFTTMGRIRAASESKDLPFQEASTMLGITGRVMEEIRDVEALPKITFQKAEMFFNEETRLRLGYLAYLDVLPHQLAIVHPYNIVCGPMVFVVQVPHTRFMMELSNSLECTIRVGEKDPQSLRVYQHNKNLEIVLNVKSEETHTLSVQLYRQHVVGSPYYFHPKRRQQVVKASDIPLPLHLDNLDDVSDSTSPDEYGSVTKEPLRSKMSMTGVNMAKRALLAAHKQNSEIPRNKSKERMEESRKQKASKNSSASAYQDPSITLKTEAEADSSFVCNVKVEQLTNGNIADDEDDYRETSDNQRSFILTSPNAEERVEVNQNRINGTTPVKTGENVDPQNMLWEEYVSDDIKQKASRKPVKLNKPLRRPRLPTFLTNVPGCYSYDASSHGIKSEPITDKVTGENHEISNECYQKTADQSPVKEERELDDYCMAGKKYPLLVKTLQSEHFTNLCKDFANMEGEYDKDETGSATDSSICFMGESCAHQKIIGVCTAREDDLRKAKEDKTFNYMLSKIEPNIKDLENNNDKPKSKVIQRCDDNETERRALSGGAESLLGKMVYITYGPVGDSLYKPIGVAELPDGNVVVTDTFNDRIALFDKTGKFIKYFRTKTMNRPSAVVALNNGRYAVKDCHSITIFSNDGSFDSFVISGLKKPYGLTLDDKGDLMTVQTTVPGCVELLTISPDSGKVVSRLKVQLYSQLDSKRLLSKPRFISYYNKEKLLIVDLGLNCIYVVDTVSGKILYVFGEEGKQPGQFLDPSGIACDIDGYILVGDSRNHRVQIFSPEGKFVCVLTTNTELCRPSGICLTSDGHLYILNYWNNSLAKYLITN